MAIPKEFLTNDKIKAVCIIRNLKNEKVYLYKTDDAVASYSSERFKLDLGMHPCTSLQKEYTSLGLELFTIEIDKTADKDDNLEALLEERKSFHREKGVKLYND